MVGIAWSLDAAEQAALVRDRDAATGTFTITINPALPLVITLQQWAPATVGSFSNLWIDGGGGVRPYRWAVAAGQLPPRDGAHPKTTHRARSYARAAHQPPQARSASSYG